MVPRAIEVSLDLDPGRYDLFEIPDAEDFAGCVDRAIEGFIVLFDKGAFAAAGCVAEEAKKRVAREDRKRELNVLEQLTKAFDSWERFDYGGATTGLKLVEKGGNDLRAVLGAKKGNAVLEEIGQLASHLNELREASHPSRHHMVDLLANAQRRRGEGRFDDVAARLYRAIEAAAQVRLAEAYGIRDTGRVPLERVPEDLRKRLEARREDGYLRLGLQDAYALLAALGDSLGDKFRQAGLSERESVLTIRNRSVLAHGFEQVSRDACDHMWQIALDLTAVGEEELPKFPRLSREL
jgi:CRISPR-associated protein (TIGR02710 family)